MRRSFQYISLTLVCIVYFTSASLAFIGDPLLFFHQNKADKATFFNARDTVPQRPTLMKAQHLPLVKPFSLAPLLAILTEKIPRVIDFEIRFEAENNSLYHSFICLTFSSRAPPIS